MPHWSLWTLSEPKGSKTRMLVSYYWATSLGVGYKNTRSAASRSSPTTLGEGRVESTLEKSARTRVKPVGLGSAPTHNRTALFPAAADAGARRPKEIYEEIYDAAPIIARRRGGGRRRGAQWHRPRQVCRRQYYRAVRHAPVRDDGPVGHRLGLRVRPRLGGESKKDAPVRHRYPAGAGRRAAWKSFLGDDAGSVEQRSRNRRRNAP